MSIALSFSVVNAALTPVNGNVVVRSTLGNAVSKATAISNLVDVTNYYQKSEIISQSVRISYAATGLTSPCNNCEIANRVVSNLGDKSAVLYLTMDSGESAWTQVTADASQDWKLQQIRVGVTLLKTEVSAVWSVDR